VIGVGGKVSSPNAPAGVVVVVVVVVVVLYSPNTNKFITDTCKTNKSIKHIWQVAREALVLLQLATYS